MSTQGCANTDERTTVLLHANNWGLNFLIFGLLGDILYRSVVLKEAPWDLFALIGATGLISGAYAARYKVVVINRRFMILMALIAVLAAAIASIAALITRS